MTRTAESVALKAQETHALFDRAGISHDQVVSELMGRTRQSWYNLRHAQGSVWQDTAIVIVMIQLNNLLRHLLDSNQLPIKVLPSKQANTDFLLRIYKERFLGASVE